jgi:transcriptional regulator with XRE-family HTH domain
MNETFGQKLKQWREAANISQAELARRVEVSPTYISNLERDFSPTAKGGKPQPSVETCDKIARALGVKVAEVRLAAGYAPPSAAESRPREQTDQVKDREAEAIRTGEMIQNWTELSPERQVQALEFLKFLREKHPEGLKTLGPKFKVMTDKEFAEEFDEKHPDVKIEKPKSK